jgi:hypothetical protein
MSKSIIKVHSCSKCKKVNLSGESVRDLKITIRATAWNTINAKFNNPFKKCAKCGYRYYCSSTCQQEDWVNHKLYCKLGIQVDFFKDTLIDWFKSDYFYRIFNLNSSDKVYTLTIFNLNKFVTENLTIEKKRDITYNEDIFILTSEYSRSLIKFGKNASIDLGISQIVYIFLPEVDLKYDLYYSHEYNFISDECIEKSDSSYTIHNLLHNKNKGYYLGLFLLYIYKRTTEVNAIMVLFMLFINLYTLTITRENTLVYLFYITLFISFLIYIYILISGDYFHIRKLIMFAFNIILLTASSLLFITYLLI